jgi:hypothetical protein
MMSNALSIEEKQHLLEIIASLYGTSRQFEPYKFAFNQRTVEAVEELIVDMKECNLQMKALLEGFLDGFTLVTRGWLRKVLQKVAEEFKRNDVVLQGAACRNVIQARGVNDIVLTTF